MDQITSTPATQYIPLRDGPAPRYRNLQNELRDLTGLVITRPSSSGTARRREIRQDADFTEPDLPIRQCCRPQAIAGRVDR
jgi:hypothetical protein